MSRYRFKPASPEDSIVHGACEPGSEIDDWIAYMRSEGVERVCCIQMERPELSAIYETEFGEDNVRYVPIQDYHLCSLPDLKSRTLPFLQESYVNGRRVVVHCAGGRGRTGHVLAAWLVFHVGTTPEEAITTQEQMGRNPREAVLCGNATEAELLDLLLQCKDP